MNIDYDGPIFSMNGQEKRDFFNQQLNDLVEWHDCHCPEYHRFLTGIGYQKKFLPYEEIPFLPTSVFKLNELKSIPNNEVFKIMTSSGTTGQQVSKIYLDKETAAAQQRVLISIVSSFIGKNRKPMIILDCPSVLKRRDMFSARGAGILGFSMFGSKRIYAFDDDMNLRIDEIRQFISEYNEQSIFMFGFTFMIWEYFCKALEKMNETVDLSQAVLLHGGGWKKLQNEHISNEMFKQKLKDVANISSVHDYYGMVEQTGCIYVECEYGHLHASEFSDVIVRRERDFTECSLGEKGIIQTVSVLPHSYPGHSLLTEDEGMVLGIDDCPCGRKGKYFHVFGRIKNAEIRGCSDTYEQ